VTNRTWKDGNVTFADLSLKQAFTIGEGGGDATTPDMVNGNNDLAFAREAATAVTNFYDVQSHNSFVAAYSAARGIASTDAAVLADLKTFVHDTYEQNSSSVWQSNVSLLLATHEAG
jgi:hypothetical protein